MLLPISRSLLPLKHTQKSKHTKWDSDTSSLIFTSARTHTSSVPFSLHVLFLLSVSVHHKHAHWSLCLLFNESVFIGLTCPLQPRSPWWHDGEPRRKHLASFITALPGPVCVSEWKCMCVWGCTVKWLTEAGLSEQDKILKRRAQEARKEEEESKVKRR